MMQRSMRVRQLWKWAELFLFITSIFLYAFFFNRFAFLIQAVLAVLLLASCAVSNYWHGEKLWQIGLRIDNFAAATQLAMPLFGLAVASMAVFALINNSAVIFNKNFFLAILLYPLWGLVQQYVFQGFFTNRLRQCIHNRFLVAVISGLAFGYLHWPNIILVSATALVGIIWAALFMIRPNLYVLAFCHGWLGTVFYYAVLNRDILAEKIF